MLLVFNFVGCWEQSDKSKEKEIVPFNLFDQNREIPEICKPPYTTEENKKAFVRFRGRVNRCVDIVNYEPDLNRFPEIKNCFEEIGGRFKEVTDQDCKATVLVPGAEGSAPDIMNYILRRFYLGNVLVTVGTETTWYWEGVQDYFSLIGEWFDETREEMYPVEVGQIISDAHEVEIENNILKVLWDDLQSYSEEWRTTFGEITKEIDPTNPDGSPRTPDEIQAIRLEKNRLFKIFEALLSVQHKILENAMVNMNDSKQL